MKSLKNAILILLASTVFISKSNAEAKSIWPSADETHAARIAAIEKALPVIDIGGHSKEQSLIDWMRELRVPGLSIALIEDHKVAWVRAYGVSENGNNGRLLTPRTMMQAASIAKPVTAVAVMRYVSDGGISLDVDINRYLSSWKLQQDDYQDDVTLRQLLAHTAGITPGGFVGYRRGDPLPTTVQILRGEPPATNVAALRVRTTDESVAYSGLGYTIVELALSEMLGQSFEDIVRSTVFDPARLEDTQLAADLPSEWAVRAASGHLANGRPIEGGWTATPELAAAGLWTTPEDLAKLIIEIAKAWNGEFSPLMSPQVAREILKPHRDNMGLGFVVRPRRSGWFSHSGGNQGYRAYFEMDAVSGDGLVVMTNSDVGQLLIALVTRAVAREYARDIRPLSEATSTSIAEQLSRQDVSRTELTLEASYLMRFIGKYEIQPDMILEIDLRDGLLGARLGDQPRLALKAESETEFFFESVEAQITFLVDHNGTVTELVLHQYGRDLGAKRLPR
ncbi:CubicO group peptidase (beta-lactamase class C family) [Pseudoxanthomonas japonensis]|uniref:serine hydrolase n=1 Tax=Pseudoxanthomonas japonensis TaxID=69284 RepID=UPI0028676C98|nr:serine hydrolase [Pseudoxanthomonas japonensis]MDR7068121.1 CubicO group peptidase (beta-lactamase class C family) [Pseudoxanthomonas japonensis]